MYNYNPYGYHNHLTGANRINHGIRNNVGSRGMYNQNLTRSGGLLSNLLGGSAGTGIRSTGLGAVNWSRLFTNTQKTLGFINQTLPLYNQVKPVVNNARSMLKVMRAMNEPTKKVSASNLIEHKPSSKIAVNKASKPTFFK